MYGSSPLRVSRSIWPASVNEWARFLRDITGNQRWTSEKLRTIILEMKVMDIHHIIKGISPEFRAHERLAEQKDQQMEERLEEHGGWSMICWPIPAPRKRLCRERNTSRLAGTG